MPSLDLVCNWFMQSVYETRRLLIKSTIAEETDLKSCWWVK